VATFETGLFKPPIMAPPGSNAAGAPASTIKPVSFAVLFHSTLVPETIQKGFPDFPSEVLGVKDELSAVRLTSIVQVAEPEPHVLAAVQTLSGFG